MVTLSSPAYQDRPLISHDWVSSTGLWNMIWISCLSYFCPKEWLQFVAAHRAMPLVFMYATSKHTVCAYLIVTSTFKLKSLRNQGAIDLVRKQLRRKLFLKCKNLAYIATYVAKAYQGVKWQKSGCLIDQCSSLPFLDWETHQCGRIYFPKKVRMHLM